jgi:N-methylhydantoinase A
MKKVQAYIDNLVKRKQTLDIRSRLQVMQSNGGIMGAGAAAKRSVHTVFSGPAGGALAGQYMSRLIGEKNVITLDIGGTSTDLVLIENNELKLTTEGEIGGFPIKVPSIEVHSLGAGGGSLAWIDDGGTLRVGPQSAGADPGPACYGIGGLEPAATDANLILGRLSATNFLGGEMPLYPELAERAISSRLASKTGLSVTQAALGIIRVLNSNICGGVNVVSTEKGYDLREFTLMAFGGAGPLYAVELANELKMKRVVVPMFPANFCAIGEAVASVRYDYVQTNVKPVEEISIDEYNDLYQEMKKEGAQSLTEEGYSQSEIIFAGNADLRYGGQFWELSVPVPVQIASFKELEKITRDFHEIHKKTYGYSLNNVNVVFVNFRLSAMVMTPALEYQEAPSEKDSSKEGLKGTRKVFFEEGLVDSRIYDRDKLGPGSVIKGPAIIEEYASSTVVPSKNIARIDRFRNIIIETVQEGT